MPDMQKAELTPTSAPSFRRFTLAGTLKELQCLGAELYISQPYNISPTTNRMTPRPIADSERVLYEETLLLPLSALFTPAPLIQRLLQGVVSLLTPTVQQVAVQQVAVQQVVITLHVPAAGFFPPRLLRFLEDRVSVGAHTRPPVRGGEGGCVITHDQSRDTQLAHLIAHKVGQTWHNELLGLILTA